MLTSSVKAILTIMFIYFLYKFILLRFIPKKSREIYDIKLAHRGFHLLYPENSLEAYKAALDANLGIEFDIRCLKDGNIVCFHDRYTNRLLKIPGKMSALADINYVRKFYIEGTKCKIPTLHETLELVNGKQPILIDVKGNLNNKYMTNLRKELGSYTNMSNVYFHTKNIRSYFILTFNYPKKVFFILNPFRKRFNFIKGKDYKAHQNKYTSLLQDIDIEIPSPTDIGQIITQSIQESENKNEILANIGKTINRYETRITKDHFIYNSLWLHRGIISDKYLEHSKESFEACIDFAKSNNINITVEFDVMMYKGEVRCYHNDRIPSIFGQDKSCAEKLKLENSLRLSQILEIFAGNEKYINLGIDIKDYHIFNRTLPNLIISEIENSNFKGNFILMSYNPLVLNYFKTIRKDYLRAQIGHSLSGLRKVPFFRFPWILNGVLGILFDIGNSDCSLFDNNDWIFWMIAYHKNVQGKPVLIYAPKNYMEIEGFVGKESIANFIIENAASNKSWPSEYFAKIKKVN